MVGASLAFTTKFAPTEASTASPPISTHAVPKQLGSTPRPETPLTVSDFGAPTIVVANY